VASDLVRAGALLERLTQAQDPEVRGNEPDLPGHIASGWLSGFPAPAVTVAHFEKAARLVCGEAAFNVGLLYESGKGVLPPGDIGREDPANEVWLDEDVRFLPAEIMALRFQDSVAIATARSFTAI